MVQEYSYVYNGGTMMQMVIETTVDDGTPVTETLSFSYDASGLPMSVVYNGTAYFYTVNLQGDVMAIVDATGNAVVSYAYDAWGNILSVTGTMADTLGESNPLRYRGYVYDHETDLYYLQSRYYDSKICRFINSDGFSSTGQGILGNNMVAYCNNNPINLVDYSGMIPGRPKMVAINDGGYTNVFNVFVVTDGSAGSDSLAEHCRNNAPQGNGNVYTSIESAGIYSKEGSHSGKNESALVQGAAGKLVEKLSSRDPTSITGYIGGILGEFLLVAGAWEFLQNQFPPAYPIEPGDYDHFKVTENWCVVEKNGNITTRTYYTATSYYIWWDVRRGNEHWRVVDYSFTFSTETYITP